MGMPVPEEWGGGGADTLSYTLAIEELGRVSASVAVTVSAHSSLGAWPIYAFGTNEQRAGWLPDLCSGRRLAAFGLTEPEAGSDARALRTSARLETGEWVINGAKQFITNAGTDISGCVLLAARTGQDEISTLIVPAGTPGYSVGAAYRKMGWHSSDTRPLAFDDCRVPEGNLLGARGQGLSQFLQALDGGRVGVAALAVGLAQGALDEAIAYARQRSAFGATVSTFGQVQAKLADLSAELEATRLLTYRAALLKDAGRPFTLAAAQAKLKAGRLAVRATDEAVQIHGGAGYMEEYPVCRFYRDAKVLTIAEGTDEILQRVIARGL
jgi:alkylation response protein AidB-like acyl-CoA dehydrogenase